MKPLLLIAADQTESQLLSGFAQSIEKEFDIFQLSGDPEINSGANTTYYLDLPSMPPADYFANAIEPIAKDYAWVATGSTMQGKDCLARLAGKLECAMVTDVLQVIDSNTFLRPMVAGSILATVQTLHPQVAMTVRTNAFPFPETRSENPTEKLEVEFLGQSKRLRQTSRGGARPDLAQASIVVSGGRPLKEAETFERIIGGLADALGGAVGATRAAVDSGIAPNELQVGQTGKIVAPDLYIAAGISGSTQHMAGIKDSKVIVAVNTDPDAPIFDMADLGLVADLYEALPILQEKLKPQK